MSCSFLFYQVKRAGNKRFYSVWQKYRQISPKIPLKPNEMNESKNEFISL